MSRGRALRLTAGAIGIVALAAAWFVLAPRALGGRLSYVVVARGTSMEPSFHAGDLALVRPAEAYSPGQVVAYRSRELGTTVLHRIVELDGNRYIVKGDNNDYLDPEHPRHEDILGALWVRVPVVGSIMSWMREPANAAMLAGAAVFLGIAFAGARRRARRGKSGGPAPSERSSNGASARNGLGVAATATGVFLLLGVIAFSRPETAARSEEIPFRHSGSFAYRATVPVGPVYPDGVVRTGDPVFLRLVDAVDVTYRYSLDGEGAGGVDGRGRLFVEISDTNGWKRSIDVQPETAFTGPVFEARGRLNVAALRRLVGSVERATGVVRDSYTVRLGADVHVDGTLSGGPLAASFTPRVELRLDALHLQVAPTDGGADPFRPSAAGSVRRTVQVPSRIALVGFGMSVEMARMAALAGGAVSALLLALFGLAALRGLRGGEASRIEARHGSWLVRVRRIDPAKPVADVGAFEDLLRIAERADRMILHEERDGTHTYVVEDGELLLRYIVRDEEPAPQPEDPVVEPDPAPTMPEDVPAEPGPPASQPVPAAMIEPEVAEPLFAETPEPEPEPEPAPKPEPEPAPAAPAPPTPDGGRNDSWTLSPSRKP